MRFLYDYLLMKPPLVEGKCRPEFDATKGEWYYPEPDPEPSHEEHVEPVWIEASKAPSGTTFICPHCREKVWYYHGSSSKSRRGGLTKRCVYRFCPWCGEEVTPLRINYISD